MNQAKYILGTTLRVWMYVYMYIYVRTYVYIPVYTMCSLKLEPEIPLMLLTEQWIIVSNQQ